MLGRLVSCLPLPPPSYHFYLMPIQKAENGRRCLHNQISENVRRHLQAPMATPREAHMGRLLQKALVLGGEVEAEHRERGRTDDKPAGEIPPGVTGSEILGCPDGRPERYPQREHLQRVRPHPTLE